MGTDVNWDIFIRILALADLKSEDCIPVKGKSQYIDDYELETLNKFDVLLLNGYKYRDFAKMTSLLKDYVEVGGNIFFEANGSPDDNSERLPPPFPIESTYTATVVDEWNLVSFEHPVTAQISFSFFSPANYDEKPWGISTTDTVGDWAYTILRSDTDPIIVGGDYGNGRVIWSGMNLIYHAERFDNPEEAKFIRNLFSWLGGVNTSRAPDYSMEFDNPERRVVTLKGHAQGILFRENYFKQWHAKILDGNEVSSQEIFLAGPGQMYVPLPEETSESAKVVLWYELLLQEKVGYAVSVITLIALIFLYKQDKILLH